MIYALALVAAGVLSLGVIRLLRRRVAVPDDPLVVSVLGYSPVLTWVNRHVVFPVRRLRWERVQDALRGNLGLGIELLAVGVWALWVGRNLLNFNPHVWPIGQEFGGQVYAYHLWNSIRECGLCGLWNGLINGGGPFLADPYGGALHPVPALATLLAGVVNGAKITLLASFWMAGAAQWWIARSMGLSRPSRLWTALAAASGAFVVGRVEIGNIPLPLSTAAAGLALAGSLDLALHPSRKAAIRFGVVLALAMVAGQGYLQIGLIFWAPWILVLLLGTNPRPDSIWRDLGVGLGLAVLLAGIFLVPFLHFWPFAAKFDDPAFVGSQPLEYLPLNLVIHDWEFLAGQTLGKLPYPYLYTLYIGWVPVILAVIGLARGQRKDARLLVSLSLGALTMFWFASGEPFRWIAPFAPPVGAVRHPALMAGLAVPAILALAGYGLDRILALRWPRFGLRASLGGSQTALSVSTAWVLLIPIVASLRTADQFDQNFLLMDDKSDVYEAIDALRPDDLEWVAVPFGEHYWNEVAFAAGLKLTAFVAPWWWDGRELPGPFLEASRDIRDLPVTGSLGGLPIFRNPSNRYAYVQNDTQITPCRAQGIGGDLHVSCEAQGGHLIVRENSWSGWTATVNGQSVPLEEGQWLSVPVPPGAVEVRFRYLPLDALIGFLLTITGIILAVALWLRADRTQPLDQNRVSS